MVNEVNLVASRRRNCVGFICVQLKPHRVILQASFNAGVAVEFYPELLAKAV